MAEPLYHRWLKSQRLEMARIGKIETATSSRDMKSGWSFGFLHAAVRRLAGLRRRNKISCSPKFSGIYFDSRIQRKALIENISMLTDWFWTNV